MNNPTCPEHHVAVKLNNWGKYSHANGVGPDGKTKWCNKTKDEVDAGWIQSEEQKALPDQTRNKQIFACNALNNATSLLAAGKIQDKELPNIARRMMEILEEISS